MALPEPGAAPNLQFNRGAQIGQTEDDIDAHLRALANYSKNSEAPRTDFTPGDQYNAYANQARGSSLDALSLVQQRANGNHDAANRMGNLATSNAVRQQTAVINAGRGPAALAMRGQSAAGAANAIHANAANAMSINNAQDTATAQNQLMQGYDNLRGVDAQAQAQADARAQYLSSLQQQQNALNSQGQFGYEKMRLGAQDAQLGAQADSWALKEGQNAFQTNLNINSDQYAFNNAMGGVNAAGNLATAYAKSDNDTTSDEKAKQDVHEEGGVSKYARMVTDMMQKRQKTASEEMLDGIGGTKSFQYKPGLENPGQVPGERNYGTMTQDLRKSRMGASLLAAPDGSGLDKVDIRKAAMASLGATADLHQRVKALEYAHKVRDLMSSSSTKSDERAKESIRKEDESALKAEGVTTETDKDELALKEKARESGDESYAQKVRRVMLERSRGMTKASPQEAEAMRKSIPYPGFRGTVGEMGNVRSADERTVLPPEEEKKFQAWARANKIRDVDHPDSHYDYRGAYMSGVKAGPDAHWPDTFKQHGHPTFSTESQYSNGPDDGGTWNGEEFVPGRSQTDALRGGGDLAPKQLDRLDRNGHLLNPNDTSAPGNLMGDTVLVGKPYGQYGSQAEAQEAEQAKRDAVAADKKAKGALVLDGNGQPLLLNPLASTPAEQAHAAEYEAKKAEAATPKPVAPGNVDLPPPAAQGQAPGAQGDGTPEHPFLVQEEPPQIDLLRAPTAVIPAHDQSTVSAKTRGMYNQAISTKEENGEQIAENDKGVARDLEQAQAMRLKGASLYENKIKELESARAFEASRRSANLDAAAEDLAKYHEDPNHFWSSRTVPQKIAGFLGLALGGFVSGATGRPNDALNMITKAVDDDIAAQRHMYLAKKDSYEAQRSSYGMAMERFNDPYVAGGVLRMAQLSKVQAMLDKVAAKAKGTEAENRLLNLRSELAAERAMVQDRTNHFVQKQTVGGGFMLPGGIPISNEMAAKVALHEMGPGKHYEERQTARVKGQEERFKAEMAGKQAGSKYAVNLPDGKVGYAISKDAQKQYTMRRTGIDGFKENLARLEEIVNKKVRLPSDMAKAKALAAEMPAQFVQSQGFNRPPTEVEDKLFYNMMPKEPGEYTLTDSNKARIRNFHHSLKVWENQAQHFLAPGGAPSAPSDEKDAEEHDGFEPDSSEEK